MCNHVQRIFFPKKGIGSDVTSAKSYTWWVLAVCSQPGAGYWKSSMGWTSAMESANICSGSMQLVRYPYTPTFGSVEKVTFTATFASPWPHVYRSDHDSHYVGDQDRKKCRLRPTLSVLSLRSLGKKWKYCKKLDLAVRRPKVHPCIVYAWVAFDG